MSSFQFPANPSDGDIVVRGNLQAFYNAATNTWRVSEVPTAPGIPGPPGPPGPEGPPGKGMEISGSVDTLADLPAPNTAQGKFWLVDDTNKVYYSDGTQWVDFGGPIQGPQGDPGKDGDPGLNGRDGKGWYGTNLIDERPDNYQISFLSNDPGLAFVTANIMGPKGDPGDMEVATDTNCGCIKIGRGLSISPDGTVNAGETFVDLETVPLTPEGTTYNYILSYPTIYESFNDTQYDSMEAWNSRKDDQLVHTRTSDEIVMPGTANGATIIWFQNTNMRNNPQKNRPGTGVQTFMGLYQIWLDVENANYTTSNMGVNHFHNTAANYTSDGIAESERTSAILTTKINDITFNEGATIKFSVNMRLYRAAYVATVLGISRVAILPYRDEANKTRQYFSAIPVNGDPEYLPPSTPEEILQSEGARLRILTRDAILQGQTMLSLYPDYFSEAERDVIKDQVAILVGARDLPGQPEDIEAAIEPAIAQLNALIDFKFRFEP